MEVKAEFIYGSWQYQEVSNGDVPMSGYRRRRVDGKGNAISNWEYISYQDYYSVKRGG